MPQKVRNVCWTMSRGSKDLILFLDWSWELATGQSCDVMEKLGMQDLGVQDLHDGPTRVFVSPGFKDLGESGFK